MKNVLAGAVLLAGLAAVTPGTTAAGHVADPSGSSSVILVDGADDVWAYSEITTGFTVADRPDADVLRARIDLDEQSLRIRMKFDDLRRVATQWYRVTVRTPQESYWYVLEAKKDHWRGQIFADVDGEWVPAPAVAGSIDYANDVVKVRIPYSSVGNPRWVQVRMRNDLGAPGGVDFFTDNPSTHGVRSGWGGRLTTP